MKKTLIALSALMVVTVANAADDPIKLGVILGFTGPIESLTPGMGSAAELAWQEVSDSGLLLGGRTIESIRADSTCTDAAAATAAAERLVTSDNVAAIMGPDCSGVTTAVINAVGAAIGVVMVSPSATSPALSTIEDRDYFFRVAPSDARQGEVLANIVMSRGINEVAITYTNNDYGKGLSETFGTAFKALGGDITVTASHEDGKADYSAEVGVLSASGAEELVVFGYVDQGGKGIVQNAIDADAFQRFIFADGMIGQAIVDSVGDSLVGSFGTAPGSLSQGAEQFLALAAGKVAGDGKGPFDGHSYDAGALIALAIQAAGSTARDEIQAQMMAVANAPGEKINPGELAKALQILADGGEIDYDGATGIEFNDVGEVYGSYREVEVRDGEFKTIKIH